MGGSGSGKKAVKKTACAAPLKAQGKGKHKRTPQSAFDPAAQGEEKTYEPEAIVGERLAKNRTEWCVKWVGYDSKQNTWEPIEHLAGCEDMIAEFKAKQKARNDELDAQALQRLREREEAARLAKDALLDKAAADRLAAKPLSPAPAPADAPVTEKVGTEKKSRRSSAAWELFTDEGADKGYVFCKAFKEGSCTEICGAAISVKDGPTGMWNHLAFKHKDEYIRLKSIGTGAPGTEPRLTPTAVVALPANMRDELHRQHARWLVKCSRPLTLCEDKEFRDIWTTALKGAYTPPEHKMVVKQMLVLSGEGKMRLIDINRSLQADRIKPAAAGDIWSDRGTSVLGVCQYYIDSAWNIIELVAGAKPFSNESHTGEAIEEKTTKIFEEVGVIGQKSEMLFFPTTDNGSNMVSGWAPFGRAPCAVHTVQLSVKTFLEHEAIAPTRIKERGIVAHFQKSTGVDGLNGLKNCMQQRNLPVHEPVRDSETRWGGAHDQMNWFRYEQPAIQEYDIQHARKAGDAYKDHQMQLKDWLVNKDSVAVLQPFADWTSIMQASKGYPTLPLMLPTLYNLIADCAPTETLLCSFPGEADYWLQPSEIEPGVLEARTALHKDMLLRWVTNLDPKIKRIYAIAAQLHPAFKDYGFIQDGRCVSFVPLSEAAWALSELRSEWKFNWKTKPLKPTAASSSDASPETETQLPLDATEPRLAPEVPSPGEANVNVQAVENAAAAEEVTITSTKMDADGLLSKKRKVTLGGILKKCTTTDDKAKPEVDELEEYLAMPLEDTDIVLLDWWKNHEYRFPKLAKMAKQYLAAPASTAGVERVFSAAGRMHNDLRKSMKDSTLEHSLFARFNTL